MSNLKEFLGGSSQHSLHPHRGLNPYSCHGVFGRSPSPSTYLLVLQSDLNPLSYELTVAGSLEVFQFAV